MWPCVSKLQTVVGVSGSCHGSTLGWLLPLNSLADRAQYSQLPQGHAPLAIVLYPGLKCASIVADMIQDISSKARMGVKLVLACAGARNNEPSDFINGVDVLVTSPPRLLKLVGQARLTSMDMLSPGGGGGRPYSLHVAQAGGGDHCVLKKAEKQAIGELPSPAGDCG